MRATQFTKLKRIFGRLIATEIATNDLVWLVPVAGQHQEATPYPMPRAGVTRSERAAALQQLQDDKEKLQNAIVKLVQRASNTDLKKPSNTRSTSCKGNGAPAHAC